MSDPAKPFSLTLWGSHPDEDNDDCWTGSDYATEAEARGDLATFQRNMVPQGWNVSHAQTLRDTSHFMVDGPGLSEPEVVSNHNYIKQRQPQRDREEQFQAAMAFGTQGWNDYEGC